MQFKMKSKFTLLNPRSESNVTWRNLITFQTSKLKSPVESFLIDDTLDDSRHSSLSLSLSLSLCFFVKLVTQSELDDLSISLLLPP